ncbi:MAG TPA: DUF3667 domain-containing protein, partial [Longimicrobiaceae bacterium]
MATLESPATPISLAASVPIAGAPACPSCGTALAGEYCHACGERRHSDERFSLRHFLADAWEDVFDLDSRALRSLRLLVTRPGLLTLEALQGRRRPYVGALRMYLVVFAVTLFLSTLLPTSPDGKSADRLTLMFKQLVHTLAVKRGMTDEAARQALMQASAQHVSWLSVLIPVLFAGFLYAVFRRRRPWYGQHLVFATHFATINFLTALVLLPVQILAASTVVTLVSACAVVPIFAWLMVAVRRVYATGWPGAAGFTLLL